MGFKRTHTIYTLEFVGGEFEGLEVKLRRGSIRERMEFDSITAWEDRVEELAKFLVSWNITDDDEQVLPLTAESLWSLEDPTLAAIVGGYREAIYPPAPLDEPSTDGANEPGNDSNTTRSTVQASSNPELEASLLTTALAG